MAWNRIAMKYAPKITLSLLKLKMEFENSKLKNVENDPEDSIGDLEGQRPEIKLINKELEISAKELW